MAYFLSGFFLLLLIWLLIYPGTDLYTRYLNKGVIKRGCRGKKVLCLTFDDGPDEGYTVSVLSILQKAKIPATFFLVGAKAERHPDLVKKIIASGNEVGLHTQWHRHAYTLFSKQSFLSISQGKKIIERIIGDDIKWFRPPWGALNLWQWYQAQKMNLKTVLWSANGADWLKKNSPQRILEKIQKKAANGTIIVLHDSGGEQDAPENMLKALPLIIDYFTHQGYRFVSLSKLVSRD